MDKPTCSIDGCDGPGRTRGWCPKHYMRWLRNGDPLRLAVRAPARRAPRKARSPRSATAEDRFWRKADQRGPIPEYAPHLGPCWIWTAGKSKSGYGVFSVNGKNVRAHRFAYELLVAAIPDGLVIDHLCRVKSCVNPGHMEPVTSRENTARGVSVTAIKRYFAEMTHCLSGKHPWVPENIHVSPDGRRYCKPCRAASRQDIPRALRRKAA